jgi:hypothetical protein
MSYNPKPLSHLYYNSALAWFERCVTQPVMKSLSCSECGPSQYPSFFCELETCPVALCSFSGSRYEMEEPGTSMHTMAHQAHERVRRPYRNFICIPFLWIYLICMPNVSFMSRSWSTSEACYITHVKRDAKNTMRNPHVFLVRYKLLQAIEKMFGNKLLQFVTTPLWTECPVCY